MLVLESVIAAGVSVFAKVLRNEQEIAMRGLAILFVGLVGGEKVFVTFVEVLLLWEILILCVARPPN